MRKSFVALVTLAAVAVSATAFAQSLRDAETALTVGNWKVLRTIDQMNDSVRCTAIYNNDYSIQLSKDTLYLAVQGGVQGVTLRFDDNPANRLRLATDMEKRIRSVIISGREFSQLTGSSRLRYQVATLFRGSADGDIDLNGLPAALDSINRQCPIEGTALAKPASASCAPSMISNMRAQGLTIAQIDAICN